MAPKPEPARKITRFSARDDLSRGLGDCFMGAFRSITEADADIAARPDLDARHWLLTKMLTGEQPRHLHRPAGP